MYLALGCYFVIDCTIVRLVGCDCVFLWLYSTSPSGVNQVDGLLPASNNTGAVVISSSLAPRRSVTFATSNDLLPTWARPLLDLLIGPLIFHIEVSFLESIDSSEFQKVL